MYNLCPMRGIMLEISEYIQNIIKYRKGGILYNFPL
jgi:hypothetical protein